MRFRPAAAAFLGAVIILAPAATVLAGPLDVKAPEIVRGEAEISTNHAFQSGFPPNADRIRHSFEFAAGYAFSDRFKAGVKLNFDRPLGDVTQLSTMGIESQVYIGKLGPTITLAWFAGLDVRIDRDETNTLVFGPLIKFGDDALSLTLNPLFEHTFGRNREGGLTFVYAAGLKTELREAFAIGIEAHGAIPDIGNAPGADFQEHRIGPVVYIDQEVIPARGVHGATKLSLEIGAFAGLTSATPDWTGKIKAALAW